MEHGRPRQVGKPGSPRGRERHVGVRRLGPVLHARRGPGRLCSVLCPRHDDDGIYIRLHLPRVGVDRAGAGRGG